MCLLLLLYLSPPPPLSFIRFLLSHCSSSPSQLTTPLSSSSFSLSFHAPACSLNTHAKATNQVSATECRHRQHHGSRSAESRGGGASSGCSIQWYDYLRERKKYSSSWKIQQHYQCLAADGEMKFQFGGTIWEDLIDWWLIDALLHWRQQKTTLWRSRFLNVGHLLHLSSCVIELHPNIHLDLLCIKKWEKKLVTFVSFARSVN